MFTLAQYVFGIGKSDDPSSINTSNENCASNHDTAYFERDDPNQCVQTNIENDWILIEIEERHNSKTTITFSKDDANRAAVLASRKPRTKQRSKPLEKLQSQEESWFVDPPECFKNTSPDCRDVKTSSLENLLIEHPSMSVFDNLFTKRVAPIPTPSKTELKPKAKPVAPKKAEKENVLAVRPNAPNTVNKKKPAEASSVNVLSPSNQNKALTAAVHTGEKLAKKKCITKKNYQRQNKAVMQRNKPMIRQVKMFVHRCGSLHNRNQC